MTGEQWFAQNQGTAILVPLGGQGNQGQCVQAVDSYLHDVYNLPYVYANAINWWDLPGSLAGNFTQVQDNSVRKGDFIIFNQAVGSKYGHIDVAAQDGTLDGYVGYDSNWAGKKDTNPQSPTYGYPILYTVSHVGQRGYIIGALRPKGGSTDVPITDQQLYHLIQGLSGRDAQLSEIQQQRFYTDPGFAIDTFWNNGGANRFANHSEAQFQQLATARDNVEKIADTRYQNEKAVADLVGVTNPDDTNSIVAKVKELQSNQGGTNPTVLAPGVYKVQ